MVGKSPFDLPSNQVIQKAIQDKFKIKLDQSVLQSVHG